MSKSIIQENCECFVCKTTRNLHRHHIFYGTGNRQLSEKYGCWCYLCGRHHNMSNEGVHFDKALDNYLKRLCQQRYMKVYNASTEDFIKVFGRNYV